jgi:hypothetical protein
VISLSLVAYSMMALASSQVIHQPKGEAYAPEAGKFSVRFPGKPKETTQTTKSAIGEVKVFTATYSTSDGNVYMVSYSDLPGEATKKENLSTLFEGIREGAKGKDGAVLDDKEIEFGPNKLPGHDLELKKEKDNQRVKLRVVVRDNRLYQVAVVGSVEFINRSKDAAAFLKSFELTK